ncbi:MAG TPA: Flp pilus assembly protein CpaB, partial [Marmoricola sp.]|nr:Flp pilus assembly protein CpaB [Marmoricola sp.]
MDRRKALLAGAAVIAILGTLLVVLYVRSANSRAASQYDAVNVLQVTKQINQGETVAQAQNDGAITMGKVSRNALLNGALTDLSAISNDVALTTLYPGEQIVPEKFGNSAASTGVPIPTGMIAISISLTDTTRVASFVNPGNDVAIFLNGNAGGAFSRLLLSKVQVIAVGSTSAQPNQTTSPAQGSGSVSNTILTLAVTQKDAQKIFFAQSQGTLSLGLLNGQSQ